MGIARRGKWLRRAARYLRLVEAAKFHAFPEAAARYRLQFKTAKFDRAVHELSSQLAKAQPA